MPDKICNCRVGASILFPRIHGPPFIRKSCTRGLDMYRHHKIATYLNDIVFLAGYTLLLKHYLFSFIPYASSTNINMEQNDKTQTTADYHISLNFHDHSHDKNDRNVPI